MSYRDWLAAHRKPPKEHALTMVWTGGGEVTTCERCGWNDIDFPRRPTTHCPGAPITPEQAARLNGRSLWDFQDGEWVELPF